MPLRMARKRACCQLAPFSRARSTPIGITTPHYHHSLPRILFLSSPRLLSTWSHIRCNLTPVRSSGLRTTVVQPSTLSRSTPCLRASESCPALAAALAPTHPVFPSHTVSLHLHLFLCSTFTHRTCPVLLVR